MMNRTRRTLLGVVLVWAFLGGTESPVLARGSDRLSRAIDTILQAEVFDPALIAVDIRDLDTGRVLYERNPSMNVKPASTMKLFTTAAILDALGDKPSAVVTSVESAGRLDGLGRVLGDIYLIGRGDPNLSGRFAWRSESNPFDQLAADIRSAGITRIEGGLIGYDGLFSEEAIPDNWTADDLIWSYGAEVSALGAFDNALELRLEPGEHEGDPTRLMAHPETKFVEIDNRTVTGAAGGEAQVKLSRALGSRRVIIEGSLPSGGKGWSEAVAVPEPALFATTLLGEALARHGVALRDPIVTSRAPLPQGLRELAAVRGREVAEEIGVVNKESQNLHAEMLLRRLGLAVNQDASVESSLKAREAFLKRKGVRIEATGMYDGSGLSRADLVTARAEVDLLVAMAKHPLAPAFKESLPIAGVDGSLKRRMSGTRATGRVFAKTGSIRHVSALAGYVDATSGRHLVFSIIVNHFTGPSREVTRAMDEICALLANLK